MFALLTSGANVDLRDEIQPQNLPMFLKLHSLAEFFHHILSTYQFRFTCETYILVVVSAD